LFYTNEKSRVVIFVYTDIIVMAVSGDDLAITLTILTLYTKL